MNTGTIALALFGGYYRERRTHFSFLTNDLIKARMYITVERLLSLATLYSLILSSVCVTMGLAVSALLFNYVPIWRFIFARDIAITDRLGLVVFARRSFTQCPLTTDYDLLKSLLDKVDFGMVEDRTAIGLAIANAANRLKDSNAKSKIIILLTDGVNNVDDLAPLDAAKAAAALGIKIYTIGAGRPGLVDIPVQTAFGIQYQQMQSEIDEQSLMQIADITGGKFYRAKDESTLEQIYDQISKLEKTKIEVHRFYRYNELFANFLIAGLGLLLAELLISRTILGGMPE